MAKSGAFSEFNYILSATSKEIIYLRAEEHRSLALLARTLGPYLPYSLLPRSPQGLIFVVDSNDRERILEAKEELFKLVSLMCQSFVRPSAEVLFVLICSGSLVPRPPHSFCRLQYEKRGRPGISYHVNDVEGRERVERL